MSFVSTEFALLLLVCFGLYFWLGRRAQNWFLLALSYWFYGSWDYRFLSLLALSTLTDYVVGKRIARAHDDGDGRRAKQWLWVSLGVNLGVLGFFKYYNFFALELQSLLHALGVDVAAPVLSIVLPVGISFYTFQTLSYCIDIFRKQLRPCHDPIDFAVFVAFFPQLVAGPIERAAQLLPQFQRARHVRAADVREGLWLVLIGYARKVVVADTAAHFADPYFSAPADRTTLELCAGLLLFSLQIYGDFAGYTDIARGVARLLGFELMRNFRQPYFATDVADFWRRWHISLSTWLRDYLYIPLGGSRGSSVATYRNLMLTMLLGGLWHGASWNFVFWGGLHGLYLAVHRGLRGTLARLRSGWPGPLRAVYATLAAASTYVLVTFTWLFFRSTSSELSLQYLHGLGRLDFGRGTALLPFLALGALTLAIDLPQAHRGDEHRVAWAPAFARLAYAALWLVLLALSEDSGQPFIYFQF